MDDSERLPQTLVYRAVEGLGDGLLIFSASGSLLYGNRAARELLGFELNSVLQFDEICRSLAALAHPEGEVFWESTGHWLRWRRQELASSVRVLQLVDLGREQPLLSQLQQSEERARLLALATNHLIYDWNLRTGEVWWEGSSGGAFGYTHEDMPGCYGSWVERLHPEDRAEVLASQQRAFEDGSTAWTCEYRFLRKDGSFAHIQERARIFRDAGGVAVRMVGGFVDLSERKDDKLSLRRQAALLDEASDAIVLRDLENRVLYMNRRAQEFYGWDLEQALGRRVTELYAEESEVEAATRQVLESGECSGEFQHRSRLGEERTVFGRWTLLKDAQGQPECILAINTDVTERKKLEQQFLRTQRMESIGTLASGMAHDLNNILAPILMSLELLREHTDGTSGEVLVDTLESGARRGADLIRQVLGLARGLEGQTEPLDLGQLVRDILRVLGETFPKNIQIISRLPEGILRVLADATQMQQVLMNLCVNARDAMPGGGMLTISLENSLVDEMYSGMHLTLAPGPYVILQVEDSGTGIAPDFLERIFEPFFTTKRPGEGTGLGLSTCFSIVKNHRGVISVYSEVGKGTRFKVYLPALAEGVQSEAEPAPALGALPRGEGQWILVVDDEENIREITRRALERFGYRVLLASNGAEGVSIFAQYRSQIAVVLTDMSMPVMDGPAMIFAIKSIDPCARIIGCSGLTANGYLAKATEAGVEHFLAKPYTADVLLRLLHQMVVHPSSSDPVPSGDSVASHGAVLVVEDEPSLRRLAARVLEREGHRVVAVESAEEALKLVESQPFRLILADLNLPGMDGQSLFERIRIRFPRLPFVLSTGAGTVPSGLQPHLGRDLEVLHKPYTLDELRNCVRQLSGENA